MFKNKNSKPEIIKRKTFTVYRNKTFAQYTYEIQSGLYIYTLQGTNICCIVKRVPNGYMLRLNNGDELIIEKDFYDFYHKLLIKGEVDEPV